ncbi:MAG: alpha/beta hydrolase [Acidobacteria bacterium]|nr:alpha/beta hydrolase [Acidobacteriota bacterium]
MRRPLVPRCATLLPLLLLPLLLPLAAAAEELPAAPPVAGAPATRESTVELTAADGVLLKGVLAVPDVPGTEGRRWPVAILIHDHKRSRDSLLDLCDALAAAGVASVRMDQRGFGQSTATADKSFYVFPIVPEAHLRRAVGDQKLLLEWLRQDPAIDATRLAVVGVGHGALTAAEFAGRGSAVKALVAVDPVEAVAGFRPEQDLATYDRRPALIVCSAFPQSRARAARWAEYGLGPRVVHCDESFDSRDRLLRAGADVTNEIATWVARELAPPASAP